MSKWNHAMCGVCWYQRNPQRQPYRVVPAADPEPCCFCGTSTEDGIYIRECPTNVACGGEHPANNNLEE